MLYHSVFIALLRMELFKKKIIFKNNLYTVRKNWVLLKQEDEY